MKKNRRKKRSVTLIEIMIVILLIGLIGGALAFNMRGSVDKGKVFKSNQNAARVYDILMMANAAGKFELGQYNDTNLVRAIITDSPLAKDADQLLKDGWGQPLTITLIDNGNDLKVFSVKAEAWENAHRTQ